MAKIECPACGGDGIGGGEYVPELCGEGEDRECERCNGTGEIEANTIRCTICRVNVVDARSGFDTCDECEGKY